ncbi:MAG: helix-turn-helix domain-containing protein [Verrucomicrobia bacterium]|nr:helix-turn-helix domain-containing protein [Verrucomicrobiota bacterium]
MTTNALFLTNIICPLLSGLPLLTFAFYFFYAEQGLFRPRARLFPLFLLSFSLYILGRPLQLLLGPAPWPLIVNALRVILFVGICCPLVLHEARGLSGAEPHRTRLRPMFLVGGALTALYIFMLLVAPSDTPLLFELGSLKAFDITPRSLTPPLFAREITILIQVLAAVGFFGLAGYETLRARRALIASKRESRHLLYFALGCLIFGGAVVLGTVTKQWWFYYLASVPSAFFIGLGVREDMLYVRQRVEQVTPFLRDELFHALGSGPKHEAKVRNLKTLLGKQVSPTLVLTISSETSSASDDDWLTAQASARERLAAVLDEELGEAHYLLLPVGAGRFAVCLDIAEAEARALADRLRACLAADAPAGSVVAGIGATHPPQELQHSYLEAQTALRAAEQSDQPIVSYIDIGALPTQQRFPVEARDEFLLEFKHVHHDAARRRLQILLDQLVFYAEGDVMAYRVRLQELLGTILAQREEQGGSKAILTEAASCFTRLDRSESVADLTDTLTKTIERLLSHVEAPRVEATGGNNPLQRAKAYIDENLVDDLKIDDVAARSGVSTSQLQRIFRDTLGMPFSTYLTTSRMTRAKELLAGTDRPITDIAFDVGYNDSNYFSTAFRKHEGISPSQYRKN